jgi:hypothetical protein
MHSPLLAWLPVSFWTISPLALVGLVLGLRRVQRAWPLYLLVLTTTMTMVSFYVLGRFRIALVGASIPFAALTIVQCVRWLRERRLPLALATCAGIGVMASWTGRPLSEHQILIRTADWILPYSVVYQEQISAAVDRRDWNTAAMRYLEFFHYEPSPSQILESSDRTLAPELADMHRECAQILQLAGRTQEAHEQLQAAQRILALRPLH